MPLRPALLALLLTAPLLGGCSLARRAAVSFVYERAELPADNVVPGVPYVDGSDDPKHRLNLFVPLADSVGDRPWPTVVFVHGGGWNEGDRDYAFGGADVYNNIGRFFARHGIGAATVSYRLQPGATWRAQVADVARAAARTRRLVADRGGNPDGLVLMGHSAGAHLAARAALDADAQAAAGLPGDAVCGVVAVSGAALDLTDRRSFAIAEDFGYYGTRFGPPGASFPDQPPPGPPAPWQRAASVVPLVTPQAPPFLVVHAEGDYPALVRQSELLVQALREAGVPHALVVEPGSSHSRIVPTLSRPDRTAGGAALEWVRGLRCD